MKSAAVEMPGGGVNDSLPFTAIKVASAPRMYFDMSDSNKKKFLSAGAMPDIGWVTNTTEYIDSPAMMIRIKQKVTPMANFSSELSCSSEAFKIMVSPFQVG